MDQKLHKKLLKRREEGTLRSLSLFEGGIDFFSNDYLGLAKCPSFSKADKQYGGTGSRLISGSSKEALDSEAFLAGFFSTESALIFNSGYDANLGFFSCVPQKGDTVIYDKHIHASIRDGLQLSQAKSVGFAHNDMIQLERLVQNATGTKYVVVESLYSMDGDIAPLKDITTICNKYNAWFVVDEAHACGVFGEMGRGIVDALGLNESVFARIITFGKAYGAHGAAIIGSQRLREYLVNFARSFIFTTALPPDSYERIRQMVGITDLDNRRGLLQGNIKLFRELSVDLECISEINSPIQIIRIGDVEKAISLANKLREFEINVKAILSPTVPTGHEGLRICLHSFNSKDEINTLVKLLKKP